MRKFQLLMLTLAVFGCDQLKKSEVLPILGRIEINEKEVNGEIVKDTMFHHIADFRFMDQDSTWITNETFAGQVYVADFFFTSCPTICPVMKTQLLRVYEAYENNPQVAILSHTIDPNYDTIPLLKNYAERLGVKSEKWHFVTGEMDNIYTLAEKSYMSVANQDAEAPGGFIHSGAFLLVDQNRHIRGYYDGTLPDQVDILINDIKRLIKP